MARRVAVAVPASNEASHIVECVAALLGQTEPVALDGAFSVHVLANNCVDDTAHLLRRHFACQSNLYIEEIVLPPARANAGWARRIAMERAAAALRRDGDVIMSTDADTVVAPDWIQKTLRYFDGGFDAVAGIARVRGAEWRQLTMEQKCRLRRLAKYKTLLSYLKKDRCGPDDPWPNHDYEGGASLALTRGMYRAIGGCPPLPTGEDRALFEAVRARGGKVRHALDVKVFTSGRQIGRAVGGMADTIRDWCNQSDADPIHETWRINAELGYVAKTADNLLTFDGLSDEIEHAKALVRSARQSRTLALTG
jgi:GT2 family glycosyltransferase